MDFADLQARARAVRSLYADVESERYGRSWTTEEIFLGMLGDVGDLAKLVQGKAGVRPREDLDEALAHDLPTDVGHAVWDLVQRVAVGIRTAYDCDGVSVRQHNEPAGNQDVWHLRVHVFPRHDGDRLYERHRDTRWVPAHERRPYADALAGALSLPRTF